MKPLKSYNKLIETIGETFQLGRQKAASSVNTILVQTYWEVGRYIVEYEQGGQQKAEYGSQLLD